MIGSNAMAGSDHHGEFVERSCHTEMPAVGVDTELVGHCCVVRSRGAFIRSNAAAGSDHHSEFVERGCHTEVPGAGVDTELVVTSS